MDRAPASREVLNEATRREHTRWRAGARSLVLATLALVVLYGVVGVAIAKADESPAPTELQAKVDATRAWLADTLHAEVLPARVLVSTDMAVEYAGTFSPDETIRLRPSYARSFLSTGAARTVSGPTIVLHESLHRAATCACWLPATPDGINVEEGVTQAVVADLMPAWGWRFWRVRGLRPYVMYPRDVAAIRAWSARYTGSGTWRTAAAATARRVLWGASCEGRAALLTEVR